VSRVGCYLCLHCNFVTLCSHFVSHVGSCMSLHHNCVSLLGFFCISEIILCLFWSFCVSCWLLYVSPMFPQPYVPTALCSHSSMFVNFLIHKKFVSDFIPLSPNLVAIYTQPIIPPNPNPCGRMGLKLKGNVRTQDLILKMS